MQPQLHLSDEQLPDYLRSLGLAAAGDLVEIESAGDGNINWVRRATLRGHQTRSLIVKQARPNLEKFPEYEAPVERLAFEARWFELAADHDPGGICPRIDHFDAGNHVLIMEDLGHAERLDAALARDAAVDQELRSLAALLARVHAATASDTGLAGRFDNAAMQRLHGDHIFALPYQAEFPCPPATAARAETIRSDPALREIAARAYERYLTPVGALIHADVQAGNILLADAGPKLLDAEIAHVGDPAFDVGTLVAHVLLPALARGGSTDAARGLARDLWASYQAARADERTDGPAAADVVRYAALELIRRTIGAARVGAVESDEAGCRVLEAGVAWLREPPVELLEP